MNKEALAQAASDQYSQIRHHSVVRMNYLTKVLPPDPYRTERQKASLEREREDHIDYHEGMMSHANLIASSFYENHHAELYDLAKEEMEAQGIPFSEGSS